jgi:tetratricopeptide (TPR) repeat protein
MVRKKPADAAAAFQSAVDVSVTKEPATYVRLAQADNMLGKYDDALANAEKAMNSPSANAAVKQFAQAERARAMQKKGGAAPSNGAPSTTAPPATAPPATPPAAAPAAPPQP